jgi:hypothetical protein
MVQRLSMKDSDSFDPSSNLGTSTRELEKRSSRKAHNLEIRGSSPLLATNSVVTLRVTSIFSAIKRASVRIRLRDWFPYGVADSTR